MTAPTDRNISAKGFEKLSKYKDFEIEISRMWQFKPKLIPVVLGALRMIKKGTDKFVD